MKVHETRSHAHAPSDDEKMVTRKQKADAKSHEEQQSSKKAKSEDDNGDGDKKSTSDAAMEFEKFCKAIREHLSIEIMREILETNNQDASGSDDAVVPLWCQDIMFYGAPDKCPICGGTLEWTGTKYSCKGDYSEWSTCTFTTNEPPRVEEPIKLPESVQKLPVADMIEDCRRNKRSKRDKGATKKLFEGMTICLSGRLSRTHQEWKSEIEKHGGKVSNSVSGVACLVTTPAERERGGSIKIADALERGIPIVSEAWLIDSIEQQKAQPLDAYDISSYLVMEGDKQESPVTEVKVYGKRGVHKDSKLHEQGGEILERDGILFNCAFCRCDLGKGVNQFCVMQLIMVRKTGLYHYYKHGRLAYAARAEERLEEREDTDGAIKEFAKLFQQLTGNEFEAWEREKKFQKKRLKFHPVDMDDGVDARHGGLGPRQQGVAVAHCKLDPRVANFMKILCSRETYGYALLEMGHDPLDLPMAMLSDVHLKKCEVVLLQFIEAVAMEQTRLKTKAAWEDFSTKWFTLMPSTRPFVFRDYQALADHAAAGLESVRDITVASHLIGDMNGPTLDDPLFDRYKKLGSSISPLEKDSDDYKMIVDYLEKTYEPVKIGDITYGVSIENILAVESSACPSYDEIKRLPNKVLLWCGTRSSNLLRHLHKGFIPAICWLPVPGYMFGRAIVCSDAAAEAARYGFTAVERPEGFLVLAIASLGEKITEYDRTPTEEEVKILEEKKMGVKGLGRRKTDESEHFVWKDDIKVPYGRLVTSKHKDSPLEYNEYAVYDPKQVSIRFLVAVKYEEQDVVYELDVDPGTEEI